MSMNYSITRAEDCEKAAKAVFRELMTSSQTRAHISIEFYDDKCNSCGKPLAIGDERKYAGYTRCRDCKADDEEFDEEMS